MTSSSKHAVDTVSRDNTFAVHASSAVLTFTSVLVAELVNG